MRILIFRPDNIGDAILFSGSLKHIRILYPNAHITLGVKKHVINLFDGCKYVDKVVSLEMLSWCQQLKEWRVRGLTRYGWFVSTLNRIKNKIASPFDLILYPVRSPDQQHLKILFDTGVKTIIGITGSSVNMPLNGYDKRLHPDVLFSKKYDVSNINPNQHELYTTLGYLKFIGCDIDDVHSILPEMLFSKSDNNYIYGIIKDKIFTIGLFPGASHIERCWDAINYTELSKLIIKPLQYVIFGGLDAIDFASSVESAIYDSKSGALVYNLTGKTSLRELYKCISYCDIFMGMDSCGLHMAIAAGVPSVGISGGMWLGRFLPWGDSSKHIIITNEIDCFGCRYQCGRERYECIQGVRAKEVANAINNIIVNILLRQKHSEINTL